MKRYLLGLALLLSASVIGAPATQAGPSEVKVVSYGYADSLLRITCVQKDMSGYRVFRGSGVFTEDGVYTCWHVVEGGGTITVMDTKGRVYEAGWVKRLGQEDAALIRLKQKPNLRPVPIADAPLEGAAYVHVMGYWGRGMKDGYFTTILGVAYPGVASPPPEIAEYGQSYYGLTMPLIPGMSGSPIIHSGKLYALAAGVDFGNMSYGARVDRKTVGNAVKRIITPQPPLKQPRGVPGTCDPDG